MNVVSLKSLRAFWEQHDQAKAPLRRWLRDIQKAKFADLNERRAHYPRADYFVSGSAEVTIFDVAGNKYRVVTFVRYSAQTIFIKRIMTHADYDK